MSQVTLIVPYISIYLDLPHGTEGNQQIQGPILHTLGLFPERKGEGKEKMGCQQGYLIAFSVLNAPLPLLSSSPPPHALSLHLYPKIHGHI